MIPTVSAEAPRRVIPRVLPLQGGITHARKSRRVGLFRCHQAEGQRSRRPPAGRAAPAPLASRFLLEGIGSMFVQPKGALVDDKTDGLDGSLMHLAHAGFLARRLEDELEELEDRSVLMGQHLYSALAQDTLRELGETLTGSEGCLRGVKEAHGQVAARLRELQAAEAVARAQASASSLTVLEVTRRLDDLRALVRWFGGALLACVVVGFGIPPTTATPFAGLRFLFLYGLCAHGLVCAFIGKLFARPIGWAYFWSSPIAACVFALAYVLWWTSVFGQGVTLLLLMAGVSVVILTWVLARQTALGRSWLLWAHTVWWLWYLDWPEDLAVVGCIVVLAHLVWWPSPTSVRLRKVAAGVVCLALLVWSVWRFGILYVAIGSLVVLVYARGVGFFDLFRMAFRTAPHREGRA